MAKIRDLTNLRGFEQSLRDATRQDHAINADLEVTKAVRADRFGILSGGGAGVAFDVTLGATSGTFNQWAPYKNFTGYAIWQITAPSDFAHQDNNALYTKDRRQEIELAYENVGQALSLGSVGFDNALVQSGTGTFTDQTAEAASDLGTEFSCMEGLASGSGNQNYLYVGLSGTQAATALIPFKGVAVTLQRASAGLSLYAEYYSADNGWTSGNTNIISEDATSNFTRTGRITLQIPVSGDDRWIPSPVNGTSGTWVRFGSSAAPSRSPNIYAIRPASGVEDLLIRSTDQLRSQQYAWTNFNSVIYATIPNAGNGVREGIDFVQSGANAVLRRNYFSGMHRHYLAHALNTPTAILLHTTPSANAIKKIMSGNPNWTEQVDITSPMLTSGTGVTLFDQGITTYHWLYVGCEDPFDHFAYQATQYQNIGIFVATPAGSIFEYQSGTEGTWAPLWPYAFGTDGSSRFDGITNTTQRPWNFRPNLDQGVGIMRWSIPNGWVKGSQSGSAEIDPNDTRDLYYIRWRRSQITSKATTIVWCGVAADGAAAFSRTPPAFPSQSLGVHLISTQSGTSRGGFDFYPGGETGRLHSNVVEWTGMRKADKTSISGDRAFVVPRPDLEGASWLLYDWDADTWKVRETSGTRSFPILSPSRVITVSDTINADFEGATALEDAASYITGQVPTSGAPWELVVGPGVYLRSRTTPVIFPNFCNVTFLGNPILSGNFTSSQSQMCHFGAYSRIRGPFQSVYPFVLSGPGLVENWEIDFRPGQNTAANNETGGDANFIAGVDVYQAYATSLPTVVRKGRLNAVMSGGYGIGTTIMTRAKNYGVRINNQASPFSAEAGGNGPVIVEDNYFMLSGGHPIGIQTIRFGSGSRLFVRNNVYDIRNPLSNDWHHVEMTNRLPEWSSFDNETVFAEVLAVNHDPTDAVGSRGFYIHSDAYGHGLANSPIQISQVFCKNVRHMVRYSGSPGAAEVNFAFGNSAQSGVALFLDDCTSTMQHFGGVLGSWFDAYVGDPARAGAGSGSYVTLTIRGGHLPIRSGNAQDGTLVDGNQGWGRYNESLGIPVFESGSQALYDYWNKYSWDTDPALRSGAQIFVTVGGSATGPQVWIRSGNGLHGAALATREVP